MCSHSAPVINIRWFCFVLFLIFSSEIKTNSKIAWCTNETTTLTLVDDLRLHYKSKLNCTYGTVHYIIWLHRQKKKFFSFVLISQFQYSNAHDAIEMFDRKIGIFIRNFDTKKYIWFIVTRTKQNNNKLNKKKRNTQQNYANQTQRLNDGRNWKRMDLNWI